MCFNTFIRHIILIQSMIHYNAAEGIRSAITNEQTKIIHEII